MNTRILRTLIAKDLTLYFRNRFFAFITVLALAGYAVIYALLPATVDEELKLAVYAPSIPDIFLEVLASNDVGIVPLDSDEALRQAVIDLQYPAGVVLTGDVISGILRGEQAAVTVYYASDTPAEIVDALRTVLRLAFNELSYTLRGDPLQIEFQEQIVGPDMTGQQLAVRSRLLPLLAVMVMVLEMMGLGSLIAEEVTSGTIKALLVTPVNVPGLLTSKAVVGILLAFTQAIILMILTDSLRSEPFLLALALLFGALVVTGLAFLIASASRGMMSVMAWSILVIIIMLIPAYGVVFPGAITQWAQIIPSYYMFDTIHQVVNFGASWDAVSSNLLILLAAGLIFMGAGMWVLERKMR